MRSRRSNSITGATTVLALLLAGVGAGGIKGQVSPSRSPLAPLKGSLERITVHGASLEGNLAGDPAVRQVSVYLPPSYASDPARRYPVLYMLHGFTDSDEGWFGWIENFVNVPAAMERALANGTVREIILVMPNAYTAYQGSMYSSSVTTGDWETFIAENLVSYIDEHYRTIPARGSRGLTGHSMGGYGSIRIGMKRPDVFSSIYAMSSCCLVPNLSPERAARAEAIRQVSDLKDTDFGTRAMIASAAAWSPNPDRPPLYLDLPRVGDEDRQAVVAAWMANAPVYMVHQYVASLRRLDGIAMDAGAQDRAFAQATQEFSDILRQYGIEHEAEIYDPGDHLNRVDERVEKHVLPFFSAKLSFTTGR